ncbi:MAG: hypothetical protein AB7U38_13180 [Hyphomicrobiales bacterium]
MNDRRPCINPRCRRTFRREPGEPEGWEVCCAKCWRLLPRTLTRRYRALRARDRRIDRRVKKLLVGVPVRPAQLAILNDQLTRLFAANWLAIRAFFHPTEKPAGLDAFLEEMNL